MNRRNPENYLMERNTEMLINKIRQRAENLFLTHQLMCSETVLTVLNQGLGGGLPPEMAIRLTSGLPEGFGDSGCTCGALSGGIIALGLFLGRNGPGILNRRSIARASKELHDRYKACFGSTCCRVLTKDIQRGTKNHYRLCAQHTVEAAEQAARIILAEKPELIEQADWMYLNQTNSKMSTRIKQLTGTFRS